MFSKQSATKEVFRSREQGSSTKLMAQKITKIIHTLNLPMIVLILFTFSANCRDAALNELEEEAADAMDMVASDGTTFADVEADAR